VGHDRRRHMLGKSVETRLWERTPGLEWWNQTTQNLDHLDIAKPNKVSICKTKVWIFIGIDNYGGYFVGLNSYKESSAHLLVSNCPIILK
jgi:hypothetical protein